MNYILKKKIEYRTDFYSDNFLEKNLDTTKDISVIVVFHLIDTGIPYIATLDKYFSLEAIIPKPKTINRELWDFFPKEKIVECEREDVKNIVLKILKKIPKDNKVVFLDIGGYFVPVAKLAKDVLGNRFLGVIEDTENGHQKYLNLNLNFPVISVARSLLKENEDYLVGQAVVFSAEAILREQGLLLNSKIIGIIGIGKTGNGILSSLKSKSSKIFIFDINPVNLIIAHSRGAYINNKLEVVKNSDILFLATGNLSLKDDEYKYLKKGLFLFSVTSSDDEIDLSWVQKNYEIEKISEYIDKYEKNGHYFFIINKGNAVNFLHGAVIDDFILLVQKEMIDTIIDLSSSKFEVGINEGLEETKKRIADSWLNKILKINI